MKLATKQAVAVAAVVWTIAVLGMLLIPADREPPKQQDIKVGMPPLLNEDSLRHVYVREEASRWGVDPELAIAVSLAENWSGDPAAVSSAGALGWMQVMPLWHGSFLHTVCGGGPLIARRTNACLGVGILAFYLHACGQDVPCALQRYNGARTPWKAQRYVRAVQERIE